MHSHAYCICEYMGMLYAAEEFSGVRISSIIMVFPRILFGNLRGEILFWSKYCLSSLILVWSEKKWGASISAKQSWRKYVAGNYTCKRFRGVGK